MTEGGAYGADRRLARRAAAAVFAPMLLAGVYGCSPQVASVAPVVLAMSSASEASAEPAAANAAAAPDKEERAERCAQLIKAAPGVEEIRIDRAGAIASREIRLDRSAPHPRWVVYRNRRSAPDGWRPQPRLGQLQFIPSLRDALPAGEPRYLAYAATIAEKMADSEKMVSVAENFRGRGGTFRWLNRTYRYVLVKELPCFPAPK